MKIFLCYQERLKKNLKESDKKIEENFCLYWGTLLAREERLFGPFNSPQSQLKTNELFQNLIWFKHFN